MSAIKDFFRDKSVFVTGGSGLVGQVLIEKLLRCFEIKRIYVLIRDKKGKLGQERIQKMCQGELYDRLRATNPSFTDKITGVVGDCLHHGLGLNKTDYQQLIDNVNIVFHSAATVNFDEKLSLSLKINVQGTQAVIRLCHRIRNLQAFVHVSTAYSNPFIRTTVEEKFYPSPSVGAAKALELLNSLGDETLDMISTDLIKDFPNTYCFTKHLAEDLVRTEAVGLPVVVFRPAIILATSEDPVPGWTNNLYGPTGVICGVARGVIRVFYTNPHSPAVFVPADMCINQMLVSAWDVGTRHYDKIQIYNFVSHKKNTLTFKQMLEFYWELSQKIPVLKTMWYYRFEVVDNPIQFQVLHFFYHVLPALFIDLILIVIRKPFRLTRVYKKVTKLTKIFEFFAFTQFDWSYDNVTNLYKRLPEADKKWLNFDMETLDWKKFCNQAVTGGRRYLMRETLETVPAAKRKQKILKVAHYVVTWSFKLLILYLVAALLQLFFRIFLT